jgi:hypothetical protein
MGRAESSATFYEGEKVMKEVFELVDTMLDTILSLIVHQAVVLAKTSAEVAELRKIAEHQWPQIGEGIDESVRATLDQPIAKAVREINECVQIMKTKIRQVTEQMS